ncbi:hypothetical protein [Pantoea sp. KPR_PJ]|uniref:hypothetical protein n=1 Tax=Pantoea sp. KPR_PJ TaxID=2738375 RepID=UPI0035279404
MSRQPAQPCSQSEQPLPHQQGELSASQQMQQLVEDKIWRLFGELEGGCDEAQQTAVREKIWRLAEQNAPRL